jgi:hypothetical protein
MFNINASAAAKEDSFSQRCRTRLSSTHISTLPIVVQSADQGVQWKFSVSECVLYDTVDKIADITCLKLLRGKFILCLML